MTATGATEGVEIKRSPIEGLGIFATRSYLPGDRIRRVSVVREITAASPLREDLGERREHCAYPDGKVVLIGPPDRYVNHSCDPNAYEAFESDGSYFVARRSIRVGDEVTIDYNINISGGTAWPCACGAGRCRGRVAGDFFELPGEWQWEYRPLLAQWFVNRHRGRIEALDRENALEVPSRAGVPLKVNLAEKLARFTDLWGPKAVGSVNDCLVKLVKLKGEFVWHAHETEDELFLVIRGTLRMQFREGDVTMVPGELIIVPHGVEHCPSADEEVHVLLLEPKTTRNTGTAGGERTRDVEWI